MKRYLVVYTDEEGDSHFEGEFKTLAAAEKHIAHENAGDKAEDFDDARTWRYDIYQFVSAYVSKVTVTVKRDLAHSKILP